jgi:hypothetical protein
MKKPRIVGINATSKFKHAAVVRIVDKLTDEDRKEWDKRAEEAKAACVECPESFLMRRDGAIHKAVIERAVGKDIPKISLGARAYLFFLNILLFGVRTLRWTCSLPKRLFGKKRSGGWTEEEMVAGNVRADMIQKAAEKYPDHHATVLSPSMVDEEIEKQLKTREMSYDELMAWAKKEKQ